MGYFEVGDRLIGLSDYKYELVNQLMKEGKVIAVSETPYSRMCIEIIKHVDNIYVGRKVWVKNVPYYFKQIEEPKFKIGDIIKGISPDKYSYTNTDMLKGRVINIDDDGRLSIIVMEHKNSYVVDDIYSCLEPEYFEKINDIENWEVEIKPYGNKTVGKLYEDGKLIKTKIAKKHPDDKYDKYTAIQLVTERLLEPKYYNGKVVCVDNKYNKDLYTVGKIYQFVDGLIVNDKSVRSIDRIHSFDELDNRSMSKFIEVVE